ncbi:hypothetical protein A2697_03835 [Candidatus Curtissbacteria bacterium RIFCSPHIGHO2_01_FULL_41_44]|uniref:Uncharacterized protein n=1 Tax=Candidatus Curtissbacteria bacterium RIFCSPLOWO2_01_FULL_42_50 TaxID=1797730 RepID=A0A1F5H7M6_9BACT|nr:MAG: hypothetical protein A2697_03835 [Candidatus Curtissbacteria bacterium RIFCSPHIGHO2_01_FULL_41_44]OGD97771.1 MAG: hypothetical protein A3E71_03505 [Candidatus Curtissbacteria bacterium RIFCSPHIGHO2_12_FULL_42_33]OGE00163.1 MAG: hypothetical protein A3B54_02050 [Candidatus Curtissbacteria bacterium RIFCSPLOWO2_01_FULL_42_50]OGE02089.1 MAG: hypothetical protein A3G16_00360 [Candidatus Curtissbacteria bacterium RIFCSPLOWO2_12_FULL_41_16]OGE09748.1 MAG: hypothetical protein A3H87_02380 [Can
MVNLLPGSWQESNEMKFLTRTAIKLAMENNWQEAAKINKKILLSQKDDIETLNRLAFAYSCLKEFKKAQKAYKKVLGIDPFNIIAAKNLAKITKGNRNGQTNGEHHSNNKFASLDNLSSVFLYEPGKTKTVNLLNLAPPSVLATLNCGDQVLINLKKHAVTITNLDGLYLGALPDDLAHRLLTLINGGNKYEAYIRSLTTKMLTLFIREVERSERFVNQPSFQNSFNPLLEEERSFV